MSAVGGTGKAAARSYQRLGRMPRRSSHHPSTADPSRVDIGNAGSLRTAAGGNESNGVSYARPMDTLGEAAMNKGTHRMTPHDERGKWRRILKPMGRIRLLRIRGIACAALILSLVCPVAALLSAPQAARATDGEISLTVGSLINYGGAGTYTMHADGRPAFCAEPSRSVPPAGRYARSPLNPSGGDAELLRAIMYFGANGPGQTRVTWPLFVGYSGQTDAQKIWAETHLLVAYAWSGSIKDALYSVDGSWQERREWFLTNLFGMDEAGRITNESATLQQIRRLIKQVPDDFYAFQIRTGSSTQVIVSWTHTVDVLLSKRSADSATTSGSAFYSYEGAVFEIRRASDDALVQTVTTGRDGTARFSLPPFDRYYAVETSAPKGFKLDESHHEFTVEDAQVTVEIADEPARLHLSLAKVDALTGGSSQVGSSLEGAKYQLVDATGTAHVATSDAEGTVSFTDLPLGSVTISEVEAPAGYKLDPAVHMFHVETDDVHEDVLLEPEEPLSEVPVAFDIEITKYLDSGSESSGMQPPGSGIAFHIISNTSKEVVGTIVTDESGRAATEGAWFGSGTGPGSATGALPYDQKGYTIREDADTVPPGYQAAPDWTILPDDMIDGVTLSYIVDNDFVSSRIQIAKIDAATAERIPLAGFTFELLDAAGKPITQEVWYPNHCELSEFTTDETGTVTLPEALKPGTYRIQETSAPAPYLVSQDPIEVVVGNEPDTPPLITVSVSDARPTGTATITKKHAGDGSPLAGAAFDVVAQEDIIAADGSIDALQGQIVDHVTTGSDGRASAVDLPIGTGSATYAFIETDPPAGFALDPTPHVCTVTYEDDRTPVVFAQSEAANEPTTVIVRKVTADGEALAGATFELWSEDPDRSEDDRIRVTTDENGTAAIGPLTAGTYHIREVEAPEGYLLDGEERVFTVDETGLIDGKSTYDIEASNDYTKVDISKRDITDENEIAGAQLAVLDHAGNTIERWTSTGEDHRIDALAPGEYVLVEEFAPNEYDQAAAVPFTVAATGEIQRVVMYDEPISVKGQIDKRQQIADPTAPGFEADAGTARAQVRLSDDGSYDYSIDFRNTSSTWVDECTVTDTLGMATDGLAALTGITTPTASGDYDGLFNVWYRTNTTTDTEQPDGSDVNATLSDGHDNPWLAHEATAGRLGDDGRVLDYDGWRLWAKDIDAASPRLLSVTDLGLSEGETITAVRFEFGRVDEGFTTRTGLWDRDDLKHEHDDIDAAERARPESDDGGPSGIIMHMRVTDNYQDDVLIENAASIDLFRNGGSIGEGAQLEDHDSDKVLQGPIPVAMPLAQTGATTAAPAILTTSCIAGLGLAYAVARARSKR